MSHSDSPMTRYVEAVEMELGRPMNGKEVVEALNRFRRGCSVSEVVAHFWEAEDEMEDEPMRGRIYFAGDKLPDRYVA